jgi:hypothetical protein
MFTPGIGPSASEETLPVTVISWAKVKLAAKPKRISDKKPLFHHADFRIIEVVLRLAMNNKMSWFFLVFLVFLV